jgi:hypothetical protein
LIQQPIEPPRIIRPDKEQPAKVPESEPPRKFTTQEILLDHERRIAALEPKIKESSKDSKEAKPKQKMTTRRMILWALVIIFAIIVGYNAYLVFFMGYSF